MFSMTLHTHVEGAFCSAPVISCTPSGTLSISCLESGNTSYSASGLFITVRETLSTLLPGESFFVPCRKFREIFSMTIAVTESKRYICNLRKSLSVVITVGNLLRKTAGSVRRHIEKVCLHLSFCKRISRVMRL